MTTIEVRPSEGGEDAEMFAAELSAAISRALVREKIEHEQAGNSVRLMNSRPQWL